MCVFTVQIHRRDSAAVVRSSQELATSPGDDRNDVDHIRVRLVADDSRHQLHREAT